MQRMREQRQGATRGPEGWTHSNTQQTACTCSRELQLRIVCLHVCMYVCMVLVGLRGTVASKCRVSIFSDHLLAVEQAIGDDLTCADGDRHGV